MLLITFCFLLFVPLPFSSRNYSLWACYIQIFVSLSFSFSNYKCQLCNKVIFGVFQLQELVRDGTNSVSDLMDKGRSLLGKHALNILIFSQLLSCVERGLGNYHVLYWLQRTTLTIQTYKRIANKQSLFYFSRHYSTDTLLRLCPFP